MGNCNSVDPVDEATIEEKHASPVETEHNHTENSLFEVNGYKSCLKRIENGDKIIEQLITFLESRAEVEDIYAKRLHEWDEKMKSKTLPKCDKFAQSVLLGKVNFSLFALQKHIQKLHPRQTLTTNCTKKQGNG